MNNKFLHISVIVSVWFSQSLFCMDTAIVSVAKKRMLLVGAGGKKAKEYFNLLKNNVDFVAFIQPNPREDVLALAQQEHIAVFPDLTGISHSFFDGAIIAVPHHLHFPYTKKLLECNKLVIKEKPIALNSAEVAEYRNVSTNQLPKLFTVVQRQFITSFRHAKREMANIGRIYSFKYEYNLGLKGATTGWRAQKKLSGGGALLDMGYHAIDMITTFFGMPAHARANFSYKIEQMKQEGLEDEAFILFDYPQEMGLVGNAVISRYGSEKKEIFEIAGEKGWIKVTPGECEVYDGKELRGYPSFNSKEEEIVSMFMTYLDHSDDEEYIQQQLEQHEKNMALIDLLYKSLPQPNPKY